MRHSVLSPLRGMQGTPARRASSAPGQHACQAARQRAAAVSASPESWNCSASTRCLSVPRGAVRKYPNFNPSIFKYYPAARHPMVLAQHSTIAPVPNPAWHQLLSLQLKPSILCCLTYHEILLFFFFLTINFIRKSFLVLNLQAVSFSSSCYCSLE